MRPPKKNNNNNNNCVDNKQSRNCMVRLEKVAVDMKGGKMEDKLLTRSSSPTSSNQRISRSGRLGVSSSNPSTSNIFSNSIANATNSSNSNSSNGSNNNKSLHDEKKFKGPLKKRPLSNPQSPQLQRESTPQHQLQQQIFQKSIGKAKSGSSSVREQREQQDDQNLGSHENSPQPTLVTGRARRAIKPNPKYTRQDMVTPRIIRNAGSGNSLHKQRRGSTSSDDFYNRDSSDESVANNNTTTTTISNNNFNSGNIYNSSGGGSDKTYQQPGEKQQRDTEVVEISEDEIVTRVPPIRGRGRPRKNLYPVGATGAVGNSLAESGNFKSLSSSQLQQIRQGNRMHDNSGGERLVSGSQKRKMNELHSGHREEDQQKDNVDVNTVNDSGSQQDVWGNKKMAITTSSARFGRETKENLSFYPMGAPRLMRRLAMNSSSSSLTVNGRNNQQSSLLIMNSAGNERRNNMQQQRLPTTVPTTTSAAQRLKQTLANSSISGGVMNNSKLPGGTSVGYGGSTGAGLNNAKRGQNLPSMATTTSRNLDNSGLNSINRISNNSKLSSALNDTGDCSPNIINSRESEVKSNTEDYETVPTFTIVNVNDIINKKGDVLITKLKNMQRNNGNCGDIDDEVEIESNDGIDSNRKDNDPNREENVRYVNEPIEDYNNSHRTNYGKETDVNAIRNARLTSALRNEARSGIDDSSTTVLYRNTGLRKSSIKLNNNNNSNNNNKMGKVLTGGGGGGGLPPEVLNHKLALRNSQSMLTTVSRTTELPTKKSAPRILNSMVAKKVEPVQPIIVNLDPDPESGNSGSGILFTLEVETDEDEQITFSNEERDEGSSTNSSSNFIRKQDQEEVTDMTNTDRDNNTEPRSNMGRLTTYSLSSKRVAALRKSPLMTTGNKRLFSTLPPATSITPCSSKSSIPQSSNTMEKKDPSCSGVSTGSNALASTKLPNVSTSPASNFALSGPDKVIVSRQGDKIIKKITCFETWFVINNDSNEQNKDTQQQQQQQQQPHLLNCLKLPLINLANFCDSVKLPSEQWSNKVTLYELPNGIQNRTSLVQYSGNLEVHGIPERDRGKYQPSAVMFRRKVITEKPNTRMPYDRAVIFKGKSFYINMDGKNVQLVGAPASVSSLEEVQDLLSVVDILHSESEFVEKVPVKTQV